MKNCSKTQGHRLVDALRRRPHTHLEMAMLGITAYPHKRVVEYLSRTPGLVLVKRERRGLTTWAVKQVAC